MLDWMICPSYVYTHTYLYNCSRPRLFSSNIISTLCIYSCMHVSMYSCVCVCMYMCVYIYTYIFAIWDGTLWFWSVIKTIMTTYLCIYVYLRMFASLPLFWLPKFYLCYCCTTTMMMYFYYTTLGSSKVHYAWFDASATTKLSLYYWATMTIHSMLMFCTTLPLQYC